MLVASVALLASGGIAQAAFPGPNGRVAFVDFGRDPSPIYTVNPDGSGLDQLTSGVSTGFPSWSPNSKHIAFTRFSDSGAKTWIMDADGRHKREVKGGREGFGEFTPKYTPDGRHIVYSRCIPTFEGCSIWKMRTDGKHRHALTPLAPPRNETFDVNPTVSPDGQHIAFGRESGGGYVSRVIVMNSDGSDPHPITDPALEAGTPDWSPDGERIVFNSRDVALLGPIGSSVYTIKPDGSDLDRVTPDRYPFSDLMAAYAPEGDRLAFGSTRNYPDDCCLDLFTIDPDGGGEEPLDLGLDAAFAAFPSWGSAPLTKP
jgi:Tol biopolymer transport system component